MQQHLLEHIDCNNHSHFLEEMGFVFMDQTDLKNLKKRECYCRRTLRTMTSDRLNIEHDLFLDNFSVLRLVLLDNNLLCYLSR